MLRALATFMLQSLSLHGDWCAPHGVPVGAEDITMQAELSGALGASLQHLVLTGGVCILLLQWASRMRSRP